MILLPILWCSVAIRTSPQKDIIFNLGRNAPIEFEERLLVHSNVSPESCIFSCRRKEVFSPSFVTERCRTLVRLHSSLHPITAKLCSLQSCRHLHGRSMGFRSLARTIQSESDTTSMASEPSIDTEDWIFNKYPSTHFEEGNDAPRETS
jgi:hypothetical protein